MPCFFVVATGAAIIGNASPPLSGRMKQVEGQQAAVPDLTAAAKQGHRHVA